MAKKYDFNILHEDEDSAFACHLRKQISETFNLSGFCSYDIPPGQYAFDGAFDSAQSSNINIFIIRSNSSGMHIHTCRSMFSNLVECGVSYSKIILVAYKGKKSAEIQKEFGMRESVEFWKDNDPIANRKLLDLVNKANGVVTQPSNEERETEHINPPHTTSHNPTMTASGDTSIRRKQQPVSFNAGANKVFSGIQPSDAINEDNLQRYKEAISDIAIQLVTEDVKKMKFLVIDLIPSAEFNKIDSPSSLLWEMERHNLLSVNNCFLLSQLLKEVDHYLLNEKLKLFLHGKPNTSKLRDYRLLLFHLCEEIGNVDRLKAILSIETGIPQRLLANSTSVLECFLLLEKQGLIAENELEETRNLLDKIAAKLCPSFSSEIEKFYPSRSELGLFSIDSVDSIKPTSLEETSKQFEKFPIYPNDRTLLELSVEEMETYFTLNNKISSGGYGNVYKGVKKFNDIAVAIKVLSFNQEHVIASFVR